MKKLLGLIVCLIVTAPLWAAIPSGYVSYWKMNGNLNDEAGLSNGTIQGGTAVFTDGIKGRALRTNSSGLYVDAGNNASQNFSGSFSIGGWVYVTSNATSIIDKSNWASGFAISIGGSWPGYWNFAFVGGGAVLDTLSPSSQRNTWTHIMGVYDGARMYLYRNGTLVKDTVVSAGVTATTAALTLGKFDGMMDEMIFYTRALTPSEVTALMNATRDTTPPVISDIAADTMPVMSAVITWRTNIIATAAVEYGIDTAYFVQLNQKLDTLHTVRIYGLNEGTQYRYRVRSKSSLGYESISPWQNVAVSARGPLQKPMLTSAGPRFTLTGRVWPANPGNADVCLWADDKMAALSIVVDDNEQPDHAWWISMGQKYGFRFTWLVITGLPEGEGQPGFNSFFGSWADFRTLYAAGHEIGSHSVTHNCSMTNFDEELGESKAHIEAAIPGCVPKSYGGPCGLPPPAATTAKYYLAHRGANGGTNAANAINYAVTLAGDGKALSTCLLTPGNNGWPYSYRGWAVVTFHFMQGITDTVENNLLKPLYDLRDSIWESNYAAVAQYGQERDTKTLTVNTVTDSLITFTLTDSMMDTLFNYPLTVKVRLDNSWLACSARQNGAAISCSLAVYNGNLYALVKAVPDRGVVSLAKGGTTGLRQTRAVRMPEPYAGIGVTIFDMHGRRLGSALINTQGLVATAHRGGLPTGVYLCKIEGTDKFEKRLIVR